MGLLDSNYDYNTLYSDGGRNDWETDIMEAEWEDDMRMAEERKAREKMGFTEEDREIKEIEKIFGGEI